MNSVRWLSVSGALLALFAACAPSVSAPPQQAVDAKAAESFPSAIVDAICAPALEGCCRQSGFGFDGDRCRAIVRATWGGQVLKRLRTKGVAGFSRPTADLLVATLKKAVATCGTEQSMTLLETVLEEHIGELFPRGSARTDEHCETMWDCAVVTPDGKPRKGGTNECVVMGTLADFLENGSTCVAFYPGKNGNCRAEDGFASEFCEDEGTYCDHQRCVPTLPIGADCKGRELLPNVCGAKGFCGQVATPAGVRTTCQASPARGALCDERHLCDGNSVCTRFADGLSRCWRTHNIVSPQTCGLAETASGVPGGG
jgi:hypothetical protein